MSDSAFILWQFKRLKRRLRRLETQMTTFSDQLEAARQKLLQVTSDAASAKSEADSVLASNADQDTKLAALQTVNDAQQTAIDTLNQEVLAILAIIQNPGGTPPPTP